MAMSQTRKCWTWHPTRECRSEGPPDRADRRGWVCPVRDARDYPRVRQMGCANTTACVYPPKAERVKLTGVGPSCRRSPRRQGDEPNAAHARARTGRDVSTAPGAQRGGDRLRELRPRKARQRLLYVCGAYPRPRPRRVGGGYFHSLVGGPFTIALSRSSDGATSSSRRPVSANAQKRNAAAPPT
jgi:hypothetical protein